MAGEKRAGGGGGLDEQVYYEVTANGGGIANVTRRKADCGRHFLVHVK